MTIRENVEKWEEAYLSPYAAISNKSKGRETDEPPCDIRPVYQRDRDRILHSKSFRRMRHKTQVFLSPEGDHYRTRLTHTLEVAQIARTIGIGIGLNENLIEAIALGHDLGHVAFAHNGEEVLEGEHELCVEAIDESGNKIVDKYNFKVNKNNILCANIKIKSSVFVLFIGISSIAIGLLKFRINRNLKTKYKES